MRWVDQEPEPQSRPLVEHLATLLFLEALGLATHLLREPRVVLDPACMEEIRAHARAHRTEVGGLLLGRAFEDDGQLWVTVPHSDGGEGVPPAHEEPLEMGEPPAGPLPARIPLHPITFVDVAIPSLDHRSTAVSLAMTTEIWDRARTACDGSDLTVVGWYHTHPGLGAFFSATDRQTQRAFFGQSFSVGLVVDPRGGGLAVFSGRLSTRLESSLEDGRSSPQSGQRNEETAATT